MRKLSKSKYFFPSLLVVFLLLAIPLTVYLTLTRPNPNSKASGSNFLPVNWPTTVQIGVSDSPGGAQALKNTTQYGFRYQYLAGGVNTGNGWATWNAGGSFVTNYINESVAAGIVPVFSYYMIYQSSPGNTQAESTAIQTNLNNTSTMTAYFNDLKLFFQKAGAFTTKVVLHDEPDMWGYIEQKTTGDNAATFPVKVGSTGIAELAGIPDTAAGLAQAEIKLRNMYAPNVSLGYHISVWGTGVDIAQSNPSTAQVDSLATKATNFYNSLGANFDILFAEVRDRDASFYQIIYGNPNAAWDSADYDNSIRFLGDVSKATSKNIVLWQLPQGNTKMKALNNTWDHFQDNFTETVFGDPNRTRLNQFVNAGVVAFLFGRGADGATCACDAAGDGVTNPNPINGNSLDSLSADDDGGYFVSQVKNYYAAGPINLGSITSTPIPTVTLTTTPIPTATPTPTPTPTPTNSYISSAVATPTTVNLGADVAISTTVKSILAATALVDIEVYDPNNAKVFQVFYDNELFSANQAKTYPTSWTIPNNAVAGTYTIKIGIFSPSWGSMYNWNDNAGTFKVTTVLATPTPTPTLTPTPTVTSTPLPTTTLTSTPTPTPTPTPVTTNGTGLTGQYFNNTDFTNLVLTRIDPTVNFNWGSGSPSTTIGSDTYSIRWTGQVLAANNQTYTFYTKSDDGVRLWVDNKLIINHWGSHSAKEDSGKVTLQAGRKYSLKLEYFENYGSSLITLKWSSPTISKQIVPRANLFTQ